MEIRVGDRITDERGEWQVDTHPSAPYGGVYTLGCGSENLSWCGT
jgi:hypothetical protein